MSDVEHILVAGDELGECPIWSVEEQALYWVDITGDRFHRLRPATGDHEVFDVGVLVSAVGLRDSGGLILATGEGIAFWDPDTQALMHTIASPEASKPDARFNDAAVDRQGRFWVGSLSRDRTGSLYRLDPGGVLHRMDSGFGTSNGIGWSPDSRTMYFTDSSPRTIYAYDFDPATGEIRDRRPFVHTPDEEGVPDGLAVDSEGFVWSARWGGWKITRYDPNGRVERAIQVPIQYPTSCVFGGPQLDRLYITSARTQLNEVQREEQPQAGDLFCLQTDVTGLPPSKFQG
jgi:sugar lactone lactonase YvrE